MLGMHRSLCNSRRSWKEERAIRYRQVVGGNPVLHLSGLKIVTSTWGRTCPVLVNRKVL